MTSPLRVQVLPPGGPVKHRNPPEKIQNHRENPLPKSTIIGLLQQKKTNNSQHIREPGMQQSNAE